MHTFHSQQWLPLPTELVFAFFSNPAHLPRLMPSWQRARIENASIVSPALPPATSALTSTFSNVAAGEGSRITLSFRPFPFSPVRLQWQAEIDAFVWNDSFSDIQLRGPFAYWRHTHTFTPETRIGESGDALLGTLLGDEVRYRLPFGKLGALAHPLILRQISRTFDYRCRRTRELLMHL